MCPPLLIAGLAAAAPTLAGTLGLGAAAGAGTLAAGSTAFGLGSAAGIANLAGGLGAISTITNFIGQNQVARANELAANRNFANKTEALNNQNTQLSEQSSEDHVSNAIKSAQQFGRISATAAALGMGQSTLSPYLNAAQGAVGRDMAIEDTNTNAKRQNLVASGTGAELERQSTINSKPRGTALGLALGLGKDALGAANLFGSVGGKFGINPVTSGIGQ